jgi:Na+-driven multidrug efflux pump
MPFLKIVFPSGMIMYLEWSYFELNTLIIALLNSEVDLASHTALANIILFFYMMPKGLGDCSCNTLGFLMGE